MSTSTPDSSERTLGPLGKTGFALGDHTVNLALSALGLVLLSFLTDVAGLRPVLAGWVVTIARVVDAVTDPVMGRVSDQMTWRAGRRRPFFLLGAIPLGVFFSLLWVVPSSSELGKFVYYSAVYVGLSLSMTVLSVPYMALIPEIATGYDERTSINTYRSAAAVMGTMLAAGMNEFANTMGGGAEGFRNAGIVMGIWMTVPWIVVWWVSFERPASTHGTMPPLREGIRAVATHRTFQRLSAFYLSARIAVDLAGLAFLFFFKYYLMRESDFGPTLLCLFLCVLVSLPIWLRLARHLDKHLVFCLGTGWWILVLAVMFTATPDTSRWFLFLLAGLAGIGYAMADLMPWAMLGEAIDEGELISGARQEGLYNGVFTFLRKLGGAGAFLVAGYLLEFSGYSPDGDHPPSAILAIRGLMTIAPGIFLCIAFAIALRYPLSRARHEEITKELAERHADEHALH